MRQAWNKGKPKNPGSGRKAGTPNKKTLERDRLLKGMLAKMAVQAEDPITFFASILKDPNAPFEERKYAASELLPFMHPKLSSIEARAGGTSHEDRLERLQKMRARVIEHQGGRGEPE